MHGESNRFALYPGCRLPPQPHRPIVVLDRDRGLAVQAVDGIGVASDDPHGHRAILFGPVVVVGRHAQDGAPIRCDRDGRGWGAGEECSRLRHCHRNRHVVISHPSRRHEVSSRNYPELCLLAFEPRAMDGLDTDRGLRCLAPNAGRDQHGEQRRQQCRRRAGRAARRLPRALVVRARRSGQGWPRGSGGRHWDASLYADTVPTLTIDGNCLSVRYLLRLSRGRRSASICSVSRHGEPPPGSIDDL